MKQKLLFLVICLFAINGLKAQFSATPYSGTQSDLRSSSEDLIKLGYCDDNITSSVGVNSTAALSAAIGIPAAKFGIYAGKEITKIKIGLTANCTNVSVWIRSSLTGADLVTETVGTVAKGWKEITLATPFIIPENDIYIGYTATGNGQVGFSGNSIYDGNWLWYNGWANYATQGWGSVCIQAFIDTKGQSILDLGVESLNKAYTQINEPFTITGSVRNNSTVAVTDLKVAYRINNGSPVERTIQTTIASGSVATLNIPANAVNTGGVYDLSVTILEENGQADTYTSNNTITGTLEVFNHVFPKKIVVEEGTGAWCQWCPRGTVGMAMMKEKYPDTFIGIAVHNGDGMTVTTYDSNMTSKFFSGFPEAVVDRKESLVIDPYYDIENAFQSEIEIPSQIGIELTGDLSDDLTKIDLKTTTTFGYSANNINLKLAYVLIENGVTGYTQANAYAGGGNGPMGGFENRPSQIKDMEFNDVARGIYSGFNGIANSIPAVVTELVPIDHTYAIILPASIQNKADLEVAVLLLNTDGEIVNADKLIVDNTKVPLSKLSVFPDDASTKIARDVSLSAKFNKNINVIDPSKITINGVALTAGEISVQGRVLSIAHAIFDYETKYTVKIAAGAIENLTTGVEWWFETLPFVINKVSTTPKDNAKDVAFDALVTATFDDDIQELDAEAIKIDIYQGDAFEDFSVTAEGKVLTITHELFAPEKTYIITVPVGAIKGLTKTVEWRFRTVKGTGIDKIPAENQSVISQVYVENKALTLTIDSDEAVTIYLYDISGKVLSSSEVSVKGKQTVTFPVDNLKGVYVVKAISKQNISVKKVVL
jgi:hypothetical protein